MILLQMPQKKTTVSTKVFLRCDMDFDFNHPPSFGRSRPGCIDGGLPLELHEHPEEGLRVLDIDAPALEVRPAASFCPDRFSFFPAQKCIFALRPDRSSSIIVSPPPQTNACFFRGSNKNGSPKWVALRKHGPKPAVCPAGFILSHTHMFPGKYWWLVQFLYSKRLCFSSEKTNSCPAQIQHLLF